MAARNRAFNRKGLELTHPNAAGVDIGSASHYVAVPADRDDEPVREFASFTADLHRVADWLSECGVDTVAMESPPHRRRSDRRGRMKSRYCCR